MNAIAGLWRRDGFPVAADLRAMLAGLARFGREPVLADPALAIGMGLRPGRGLGRAGDQPCVGAGGRLHLLADIRLDNRPDLIRHLGLTRTEGEALADDLLLMRLWEAMGPACLGLLVGEYAFALWDEAARVLHLVRDVAALRPLFYHEERDFFAFASMPSALLALDDIPFALDEEHLARAVMVQSGARKTSFFEGIRSIGAGERLTVSARGIRCERYWRPEAIAPLRFRDPADYGAALRDALDQAVAAQIGDAAAVATQLSAGLDSSCITVSAALALATRSGTVTAFTAAPRAGLEEDIAGRLLDESRPAAAVAAMYPEIRHVVRRGTGRSPFDTLDRNMRYFQQPALNLCNQLWMDDISAQCRAEGLSVLLDGLLGNGTISYRDPVALRSSLAGGHLLSFAIDAAGLVRGGHISARGLAALMLGPLLPGVVWKALRRQPTGPRLEVAAPDIRARWAGRFDGAIVDRWGRIRYGTDSRLAILQSVDLGAYRSGNRAIWGIEQRHPAVDRRVVETCLAMPQRAFVHGGVPAAVYRRAFADRLPATLIEERRRGLQGGDWYDGVVAGRDHMMAEIEAIGRDPTAQMFLDMPRLRRLANDVGTMPGTMEMRLTLLRGISTGHFIRRIGEGRSAFLKDQAQVEEAD